MFMLAVAVNPATEGILRNHRRKGGLNAGIVSGLVRGGGIGEILKAGIILSAVVMVERRKLQQGRGVEVMHPGEGSVTIGLMLTIPQTARIVELVLPGIDVWIVGDLVI